MTGRKIVLGLMAFALLAMVVPAIANADEGKAIPIKDLPKAVLKAIEAVCPGGEIISAEKEVEEEDGKTTIEYEVKVKLASGKVVEVEIEMAKDGTIRKIEIEDADDDDDDDDDDK